MKYKYIKGTASLMIALVITLPIYSSFVLAGLSNPRLYGLMDNIDGYYRDNEDEVIRIDVTAWTGEDQVDKSQVHLVHLSGPSFQACIDKGDKFFECTYMRNTEIEDPYTLWVKLYDKQQNQVDELRILGNFDDVAPAIDSFNIIPQYAGGGDITLHYKVHDSSRSTNPNNCAGIKKIEFSTSNNTFKTANINSLPYPAISGRSVTFPNNCVQEGNVVVPLNSITSTEGQIPVKLTVYDNFNQQSAAVAYFTYDTQAPTIDISSLEIKDLNGQSINFIGPNPINAIVRFVVTADDLDINKVYGDVSAINRGNPPDYKNKKAACTSISSSDYRCTIANIQVRLDQTANVNIIANASDLAGNTVSSTLTKTITVDNTGPAITSIRTANVAGGVSYVGSLNTFIVELSEAGAGIDKSNIKLDLSNIKTGLSDKAADQCISSGATWACYWYNIPTDKSDGEKTIYVKSDSSDRLGNVVTGTLSAAVTVDKTPPVVISSNVTGTGVGIEAFAGHIKTGDVLEATLAIREKNQLTVYADFSSFVTTQNNITGSCSKQGEDAWTCAFSSRPIDVPGHIISNINFNIRDIAGNNVQHQKSVEVLEYEDAPGISYWTSTVTCSPNLVDRQITNLVNVRVYCSVTLHPTTPDQETLSINLGSCTDNYNNSLGYIENVQLLNAERGSTEPYLSVDLIKGEMTIDKLKVSCPLQIISRVGAKINQNPEIEPVPIEINFYNMPLGEYGKGIEDKIKDAKDDAFGTIWKIIGFLKKIVRWARIACQISYTLQKVKLVLKIFTEEVTTAHIASVGTPLEPVLATAKTAACVNDETLGEVSKESYIIGDKLCKFINCQTSPKPPDSDEMGDGSGIFGDISNFVGSWTFKGNELLGKIAQGGGPMAKILSLGQMGDFSDTEATIEDYFGKQPYQYMNARDNLLVALLLGCIPGIITGLEKYRQILCLYSDCLEQNAYNNVPVKVCEDQKSYATCKYITGEIFAVLPWTALFDFYTGMVRSALSDPLTAIATAYVILTKSCLPRCEPTEEASMQWIGNEFVCRTLQFASLLGEIIKDVTGIIDEFKQGSQDYCSRIEEEKEEED